ncbi:alpha-mannosidase [Arthrobacter sp. V1I9]|nr:alpha-mannosidase [Arthrobacter sp. V1I9]
MHDDRRITEVRLERFVRERITPAVYSRSLPLTLSSWDVPDEPVPALEAMRQNFQPQEHCAPWGKPWGTKWLRLQGEVPESWGTEPDTTVEVVVDLGFTIEVPGFQCEGIAWRADGTIIKAVSPRNQYIPLKLLGGGMAVDFYVEAAANPDVAQGWTFAPTPYGDKSTAGTAPQYRLGNIAIAELNQTVWELQQDIWTLSGLMAELPLELPRRHEILRALERMMDVMDPDDVAGTATAGRAVLAEVLARPAYASAHQLVATGHAHIDSAWLWPVRETIRKCARTFSNVVALMDEYPNFVFSCSSAQQLAWIKEYYPELFGRIREKVRAGQFVPVGGMWVESDTNMPGGEAMARQFVEGKSFFLAEFGVDCQEAWLPDSFGYSAALPQIVKSAGSRWFLTQKISWNQTNRMPHHTFNWEGIDGTRLFTHFPPVDTYNSQLSGRELAHAERNYRDHGRGTVSLVPFGYGDGGGGPTREMLAAAARTADLEGSPKVRIGSAESFFKQAEGEYPSLPVWVGEMYLELHRGTYTSQARTKKGNRRSEHLLREAELWCATAAVRTAGSFAYPAAELKRLWRLVLLQQFHDILPGSSIAWVHQDAERNYGAVEADLETLISQAAKAVLGNGDRKFLLNAAPHAREGVPALAASEPVAPPVPARGAARDAGFVLDNGIIRAVLDADGLLTSLRDYASGREAIAPGQRGNLLELHRDTPNEWDAWDIDEFYRRNVTPLTCAESVRLIDDEGEVAVVVERMAGSSAITQRISLAAGSPSLSITTSVDWQEREKAVEAWLRTGCSCGPVCGGDAVRARLPRHAHQHVLGSGQVRNLCAPLDPRGGAGVRRCRCQLVHLRPRRHQEHQGGRRRHHHHGAPVAVACTEVPRSGRRPRTPRADGHGPAGRWHCRCCPGGLPDKSCSADGHRRLAGGAAVYAVQPRCGHRSSQAGGGRLRGCDRPVVRIAGAAVGRKAHRKLPGTAGQRRRPAGTQGRGCRRGSRPGRGGAAPAAVPIGDPEVCLRAGIDAGQA